MTDFLYPFIDADERDAPTLLADLARSAEAKARESRDLRSTTLASAAGVIDGAATAMADRFASGGRVFAFGNGGSATDAAALAALFVRPPAGRPLPALSLAADEAVVTALGNDVGFDLVFSRQIIAHVHSGDIVVGLSTSGSSDNVLAAFAEARRRGALTIGLAGFDGGRMAVSPDIDHCIVVRAESVHRIQETQAAVVVALWQAIQRGPRLEAVVSG
ncbi:MAG: gmhA [Ilumatobacteraceae bacterium]|nr:gmhA [Ilumatobacteraceae bacterium]